MSYKDTKIFHKDFGDGGRKAKLAIEKIAERKQQKYGKEIEAHLSNAVITYHGMMECVDCGYYGHEKNDFSSTDDAVRTCPVCGSTDTQPMEDGDV